MNKEVQIDNVATCCLCKNKGILLYKEREDRLFDAPGIWNYYKCEECDFIWLSPLSIPSEIGPFYSERFSHKLKAAKPRFSSLRERVKLSIIAAKFGYRHLLDGRKYDIAGQILSVIIPLTEAAGLSIMMLPYVNGGRILDIGCGRGEFLNLMKSLGWEVMGVEVDAKAAQAAKESFKIPVVTNSFEDTSFPEGSFDAITLHHVIEHLEEPLQYLKKCFQLLKPQGKLVIVTPNIDSLASSILKRDCVHFSPPWHIYLFSQKALSGIIRDTGFSIERSFTSARWADSTWTESKGTKNAPLPFFLRIEGILFRVFETVMCCLNRQLGEEIVLVLKKPS